MQKICKKCRFSKFSINKNAQYSQKNEIFPTSGLCKRCNAWNVYIITIMFIGLGGRGTCGQESGFVAQCQCQQQLWQKRGVTWTWQTASQKHKNCIPFLLVQDTVVDTFYACMPYLYEYTCHWVSRLEGLNVSPHVNTMFLQRRFFDKLSMAPMLKALMSAKPHPQNNFALRKQVDLGQ